MIGRLDRWSEWLAPLLVVCAYLAFIGWHLGTRSSLHWDAPRDVAVTHNWLAGYFWSDPAIPGAPPWYPPLGPGVIAGICAITGAEPIEAFSATRWWLNPLVLLGFYAAARCVVGAWGSALTTVLLVVSSLWWYTSCYLPLPAVHGGLWLFFGLAAWHRAQGGNVRWVLVTALLLVGGVWHHPINALLLAGAIGLHGIDRASRVWSWSLRIQMVRPVAIIAGITGVLTLPVTLPHAIYPTLNAAPYTYFCPMLWLDDYALQLHMLAVPVVGVVGLLRIWRTTPRLRWVCVYAALGLVGQLPGYWNDWYDWNVPMVVPHEFQWHMQAGLVLGAAFELRRWGRAWLRRREDGIARRTVWRSRLAGVGVALVAANILWGLQRLESPLVDARRPNDLTGGDAELVRWLRANVPIEEVIAATPHTAMFTLGGMTGHRTVTWPAGHLNPTVASEPREAALAQLLAPVEMSRFGAIAEQYDVRYVLLMDMFWSEEPWARRSAFDAHPLLERVFVSYRTNRESESVERSVVYRVSR